NGGMKAVEIEPVKSDLRVIWGKVIIVRPQPSYEVEGVGVSPHPGGKSFEACERVHRLVVVAFAARVAIDPVGVGPVGFNRYRYESLFSDQASGDLSALSIKLVSAMRGFAQQHQSRIAD